MVRHFFIFLCALLFLGGSGHAEKLYNKRPYQPVVLYGGDVKEFLSVPVNEIFLFAYHTDQSEWEMIPFQIDERLHVRDPFPLGFPPDKRRERHFYAIKNTNMSYYGFADTLYRAQNNQGEWQTLFDADDELVFLIGDLGDRAPEDAWIDNPESINFVRREIRMTDPAGEAETAYGYL